MKDKNFGLDRWYSHLRPPYERVFSNQNKRTKYRGLAKNQFHAFMQTIAFNLERLVVLTEEEYDQLPIHQPSQHEQGIGAPTSRLKQKNTKK